MTASSGIRRLRVLSAQVVPDIAVQHRFAGPLAASCVSATQSEDIDKIAKSFNKFWQVWWIDKWIPHFSYLQEIVNFTKNNHEIGEEIIGFFSGLQSDFPGLMRPEVTAPTWIGEVRILPFGPEVHVKEVSLGDPWPSIGLEFKGDKVGETFQWSLLPGHQAALFIRNVFARVGINPIELFEPTLTCRPLQEEDAEGTYEAEDKESYWSSSPKMVASL